MTEQRGLTRAQIGRLLKAIDPAHVDKKQGLSYMAQHEVRAELTRIFGFGGWDSQTEEIAFMWEQEINFGQPGYPAKPKQGNPPYYRACYTARVRLTVRDYWGNEIASFIGAHSEANSVLPDRGEAHAMAVTSVESYALRRAAIGLGDRLGLGLYDDGKTLALVKGTLQITDKESPLYVEPANPQGQVAGNVPHPSTRLQDSMNVAGADNAGS